MEFEQVIFRNRLRQLQKIGYEPHNSLNSNTINSPNQRFSEPHEGFLSSSIESFHTLKNGTPKSDCEEGFLSSSIESFHTLKNGTPKSDGAEDKLVWLRSQVIGNNVEFETPFGKRKLSYADHTASGRCLQFIEDYVAKEILPFYGNSHTSDSFVGSQTTKLVHEAAKYVKTCLGGGDGDAIIFCGSGSTAAIKRIQEVMGIAIPSMMRERALKCLEDEERWVVFLGPYEHHSNILSWRQSLAEVIEIGFDDNGLTNLEDLRLKLQYYKSKNRPILGSFSACSNVTGIYSQTRVIARLLHECGAFACFDFAASGPYVKIDMRSGEMDGYDAVFLSPHKFLGGPGSPGILLMNKLLYQLRSSPPSTCGGGTVDYVNGFNEQDTLYVENIEEREDAGTPQIIQKVRAALAFWVKEYIGHDVIEKQEQHHIEHALKRLLPNPHICVLGNTTAKRTTILSFLIYTTEPTNSNFDLWRETGDKVLDKPLHGRFVAKILNDLFGIQARGGCACAAPYGHSLLNITNSQSLHLRSAIKTGYLGIKPGWTRVSFPYYMAREEVEFILASIEFLSNYGQRFLPLYHFNWNTGDWSFKAKAMEVFKGFGKNCDLCGSLVATKMRRFNLRYCRKCNNEHDFIDPEYDSMILKYAHYIEMAKRIANLLPKFPPERPITDDMDVNLVTFRI